MAEQEAPLTPTKQRKRYRIPREMAAEIPVFHANHVQVTVSGDYVGITFATRLDGICTDSESDVAVPHVACFMSPIQAKLLEKILHDLMVKVEREIADMQKQGGDLAIGEIIVERDL